MSDLLLSYIRTFVPIAVGAALTWLGTSFGIVLPEEMSAQAAILATGAVVALYYLIVRALEKRWPFFGALLGAKREPAYEAPIPPAAALLGATSRRR